MCSVCCVFSECENRCPFSFYCVLFQEGSVIVIVVNSGIFLSRCLTVALPVGIEGPECHREPLIPVGFGCECSPVWRQKVLDPVDEGIQNILHCVGWNPTIGIHHQRDGKQG